MLSCSQKIGFVRYSTVQIQPRNCRSSPTGRSGLDVGKYNSRTFEGDYTQIPTSAVWIDTWLPWLALNTSVPPSWYSGHWCSINHEIRWVGLMPGTRSPAICSMSSGGCVWTTEPSQCAPIYLNSAGTDLPSHTLGHGRQAPGPVATHSTIRTKFRKMPVTSVIIASPT